MNCQLVSQISVRQQIAFSSSEALRFFRQEWRRRIGGAFRTVKRNGESHGYVLKTVFEVNAAKEIEALRPGTIRDYAKLPWFKN